ncbi:hypothetical protein BURK1_02965 [Burkholderiales bacterium]|nr:hypothetical protein BURK1_02965 [Burkholderiales bacterium]
MSAPVPDPAGLFGALGASLRRRAVGTPVDDREPGDTTCRNCGADAPGAYCAACGQETTIGLPKATTFLREAAGRHVAFDGRMWRTLFALAFRPGFLTREYLAGRRKRYVRPSRLVLVLAIVLFAVARWVAEPDGMVRVGAQVPGDTATKAAVVELDNEPITIGVGGGSVVFDPALNVRLSGIGVLGERFERHIGAFNRLDRDQKVRELVNGMLRFGPYALIAMLPAFALLVQLLYLGRARRYPERPRRYAEHLVYGAHSHAFVALAVALMIVAPFAIVTTAIALWAVAWLFASMHAVYGGRWSGTILRGMAVTTVYAVLFVVAVVSLLLAAILFR